MLLVCPGLLLYPLKQKRSLASFSNPFSLCLPACLPVGGLVLAQCRGTQLSFFLLSPFPWKLWNLCKMWNAGRAPNTKGLGLENVGIETDKHGAIKVPNRPNCTALDCTVSFCTSVFCCDVQYCTVVYCA